MALIEILLYRKGGYRVYYGREGSLVVVLLGGGSKKSQVRDIVTAQRQWKEYLDAKANG